ncbi:ABC transporter permease [Pseudobutyrivibrio sp.]|uniref:ABC transporter permease n=1 Tax=Pseudobutyrivibrio sp. TaxID=2014367 RepID=UPI001D9B37B3|nr:ABC transporter permease [Pseudobutyrivibrio sp.]MBE5911872.1 ABC transporter permease [Pseudobutyrivibrio sp.]
MNKKTSILHSNFLYTVIAIIIGFLIGAIFLVIAGVSPMEAYAKIIDSVISKPKNIMTTLAYASPVMLTGLSVAFSFRTGVFNIGAEGQFVVGTLAATIVGIFVDVPAIIHIPLCIIAAAAAGAFWSLVCGVMKVKRGIHEVLSFIMFNWIAYYLSNYMVNTTFLKREGGGEATKDLLESARIESGDFNYAIVIAVILAVITWIVIEKTTLGYKLKAVGFNKFSAEYAGIDSGKSILTALAISGALAGIGGAVQVMGMGGRLAQFASQEGYGFEGITVALIGSSNPLGVIFAGIFYGAMKYGGTKLTMVHAPSEIINIIMGCVVIFIAIAHVFKALFLSIGKKKEA